MFSKTKRGSLLSIDFGSRAIKLVEGQWMGNKLKILTTGEETLPPGVVENGNLIDAETAERVLAKLIETSGAKSKEAIVTIETSDMIKREIFIPKVPEEDQKGLISYEIEQYLPIDTNSYILQHRLLEEIEEKDEAPRHKMLVGALPSEIAKDYHNLLANLRLEPVALDMHTNALEKLLEVTDRINDHINVTHTSLAVVDIGHKMINITIFEKGKFNFNRLIQYGCNGLIEIMENFKVVEPGENLFFDEDLRFLNEKTFDSLDEKERALYEYIEHMTDDIGKILKYFTSRSIDNRIDHVLLTGGGAKIKGFDAFFTEQLGLPVETILKLSVLAEEHNNAIDKIPLYLNAYGALIRR